jgi:hypothetical protein
MKIRGILTALALLLGAAAAATAEPLRQVRLDVPDAPALARELDRAGFDVLPRSVTPGSLELIVSAGESERLSAMGLVPVTVLVGRPFAEIQAERIRAEREAGSALAVPPGYQSLAEIQAALATTAADYPAIAMLVDLTARYGTAPTVEGRHLYALKISDQVALDEDEPAFLLVSEHHAREIVTPVIALNAIDELVTGYGVDPAVTALVDAYEIWIAPVWNPDGYEHVFNVDNLWRKNRRVFAGGTGVDLNRNYPQGWSNPCGGSTVPSSETYRGPSAASEAETQTMLAWSRGERFAKVIDYHSYGRELLHGYACWDHPFDAYMLAEATQISTVSGYGGATRAPSADGEHYQWQFAQMGAYAFLAETHTQFQPTYASAQAEAAQLWPGILWMLDRPMPLAGHVTDAVTGAPVAATIRYEGVTFQNGETNASGGSFGRYHAFLPAGTYSLRFEAEGYQTLVVPGVQVAAGATTALDVELTPNIVAIAGDGAAGGALLDAAWRSPLLVYGVGRPAHVTLRILDVRGAVVATLVDAEQAPGRYAVPWSGRNEAGRRVARGSYFYRLEAGVQSVSGKILLAE